MEEHQKALNFLVGCGRPFSWRACVLKGSWVVTRGQLKLLSEPVPVRLPGVLETRRGEFRCPVGASGGVCKTLAEQSY